MYLLFAFYVYSKNSQIQFHLFLQTKTWKENQSIDTKTPIDMHCMYVLILISCVFSPSLKIGLVVDRILYVCEPEDMQIAKLNTVLFEHNAKINILRYPVEVNQTASLR